MIEVVIIESEAGWGQRIDSIKEFDSYTEAQEFVEKFNYKNTEDAVADWYMYAEMRLKQGG